MKVTVCGGGNAGLAMAADLILKGHEVSLFEVPAFESSIKAVLDKGGITITGNTASGKTGTVMPEEVTTDPEKAVRNAEIIMFGVPAYGHEAFMEHLVPHLQDGQVVVFNTGAAQKYLEVIRSDLPTLATPVDWAALAAS